MDHDCTDLVSFKNYQYDEKRIWNVTNLTDIAKKKIVDMGKSIMTFRVWGVNPPGHLAIEVFFEDMRFPGIEYEKFQNENLITYIPTNHYEYINGVTVDFSGWNEENESNYNPDMTLNHKGFECIPHKIETSEIKLSWLGWK